MRLQVDEVMLDAVISGTIGGLQMTGVVPIPVGASRLATSNHRMSVMVGLVGQSSGSVAVSMSDAAMRFLASSLVDEDAPEDDSIDAFMEIGNMVAGCIKESLQGTEYEVSRISLPSLIVGQAYNVIYARGLRTVSVQFELEGFGITAFDDRFMSTTVSLLRGSGQ